MAQFTAYTKCNIYLDNHLIGQEQVLYEAAYFTPDARYVNKFYLAGNFK